MPAALTALLSVVFAFSSVHAAPYVPADDATVLERLPFRPRDSLMRELQALRAALKAAPDDAEAAAGLAYRYFELANAQGDPRYVGYAEATLRRWREDAPAEIVFVRGLLRQYRHDFDGALKDFERVLQKDAEHAGARSWRAAVFMVRADYVAAARECEALARVGSELQAVGCSAYVDAMTGQTRAAYERLTRALRSNRDAGPEAKLWTLTRLAEMAWRLGDERATELHFASALRLGLEDNFLAAAYADYLLERGRAKEVVALLKDRTRSDTLLLRLAIAERSLGMKEAEAHARVLAERFDAAALRGERLHMGEEARFLLELKGDAKKALGVALENWKEQREPRDALVVLEAAVAARDARAAAPVLAWLEQSRFESERLQRLAAALK